MSEGARGRTTRSWSGGSAAARARLRGRVWWTGIAHRLTPDGAERYDDIEAMTDALGESVWTTSGVDSLLEATHPLVKAVIDAGIVPGTRTK